MPGIARELERLDDQKWASQDAFQVLGRTVLVRSNSLDFAQQARAMMRSFPRPAHNGLAPDLTLSFWVERPKNGTGNSDCQPKS